MLGYLDAVDWADHRAIDPVYALPRDIVQAMELPGGIAELGRCAVDDKAARTVDSKAVRAVDPSCEWHRAGPLAAVSEHRCEDDTSLSPSASPRHVLDNIIPPCEGLQVLLDGHHKAAVALAAAGEVTAEEAMAMVQGGGEAAEGGLGGITGN